MEPRKYSKNWLYNQGKKVLSSYLATVPKYEEAH
jgi:hypothetical protein